MELTWIEWTVLGLVTIAGILLIIGSVVKENRDQRMEKMMESIFRLQREMLHLQSKQVSIMISNAEMFTSQHRLDESMVDELVRIRESQSSVANNLGFLAAQMRERSS